MERKITIALAFCIEMWKALPWYDVALERSDLAFVQELLAEGVFATSVGTRARSPYEFFTIKTREEIRGLSFKRVSFGFTGIGHVLLIYQFY